MHLKSYWPNQPWFRMLKILVKQNVFTLAFITVYRLYNKDEPWSNYQNTSQFTSAHHQLSTIIVTSSITLFHNTKTQRPNISLKKGAFKKKRTIHPYFERVTKWAHFVLELQNAALMISTVRLAENDDTVNNLHYL